MLEKLILLGFLLFSLTQNMVFQTDITEVKKTANPSHDFQDNFKFTDDKGQGATLSQIQQFKSIINQASSLYPKDDDKRLKYIADQMDKAYSQDDNKFQILQQGSIEGARHLMVGFDDFYASIANGTDKASVNRSFMFSRIDTSTKKPYFFKAQGAKGAGISTEIEQSIIRAISKADDIKQCDCARAVKRLIGLLSSWSYNCYPSVNDVMYYAYALDAQYYALKGPNCYFAMWKSV